MSPKGVLAGAGSVGISLIVWAVGGLVVMIGERLHFLTCLILKTYLFVHEYQLYSFMCPTLNLYNISHNV